MKSLLHFLVLFILGQAVFAEQYLYLLNKKRKSIDQFLMNSKNGSLKLIKSLGLSKGPSSLSQSADGKYIYTISNNKLYTLAVDKKGELSIKGSGKVSLNGIGQLSENGRYYVMYHYGANKISVQKMSDYVSTGEQVDLVSTVDHPHDVGFSNDGEFLFVPHNWENRFSISLNLTKKQAS